MHAMYKNGGKLMTNTMMLDNNCHFTIFIHSYCNKTMELLFIL